MRRAQSENCLRQESNLVRDRRRIACIRHTPETNKFRIVDCGLRIENQFAAGKLSSPDRAVSIPQSEIRNPKLKQYLCQDSNPDRHVRSVA